MTAEDFFETIYHFGLDDDNDRVFFADDMISFAEAYHREKSKPRKTELLECGSYEKEYVNKNDWE